MMYRFVYVQIFGVCREVPQKTRVVYAFDVHINNLLMNRPGCSLLYIATWVMVIRHEIHTVFIFI